jgi:hypothetical protein
MFCMALKLLSCIKEIHTLRAFVNRAQAEHLESKESNGKLVKNYNEGVHCL